ncbi:ABHD11 [Symbiodinium natans]|uniref:ABHD11 protein n=1 Tax=Symbiodinium natans TaxID=878477 RepID=A0A812IHF7_9DINO|nr:ABHD11 [Symbiodinium natans]
MAGSDLFKRVAIPLDDPFGKCSESQALVSEPRPAPQEKSNESKASQPEGAQASKLLGSERRVSIVSINVSGGREVCNGAYKFDGLHQGKPLFKSDKGAIIYFQRFWKINAAYKTSSWMYSLPDSRAALPPEGEWTREGSCDMTSGSAPTVTLLDEPFKSLGEQGNSLRLEGGRSVLKREENKSWRWIELPVYEGAPKPAAKPPAKDADSSAEARVSAEAVPSLEDLCAQLDAEETADRLNFGMFGNVEESGEESSSLPASGYFSSDMIRQMGQGLLVQLSQGQREGQPAASTSPGADEPPWPLEQPRVGMAARLTRSDASASASFQAAKKMGKKRGWLRRGNEAKSVENRYSHVGASSSCWSLAFSRQIRVRKHSMAFAPSATSLARRALARHEGALNRRGFAVLSHSWTGGQRPSGAPKVCVMMHGILGSKSNWNTPARRLLQQIGEQGWRILQLDHRGHGRSPAGSAPHNLEACKDDVLETLEAAGVSQAELVLCGHSFGGKVALALLRALSAEGRPPKRTWIFDSVPGRPAESSEEEERRLQSVNFVLGAVASAAARRFDSRGDLVAVLQAEYGLTQPVAEWIAQSVRQVPDGVALSYDMQAVRELYEAYRSTDMWDLLQKGNAEIGVVVAGRNRQSWGPENLERLKQCHEGVQVVTLENAGHNVHVDDLPGLLSAITPSFA